VSITTARNFLEKSGCGLIVAIGLAVVILGSLFYGGIFGGDEQRAPEAAPIPVATIGSQTVSLQGVERRYQQVAAMNLNVEGGPPPALDAMVYASQLDAALNQTAILEMGAKRGLKITEQEILDTVGKNFDQRVQQQRAFLQALGQIKEGSTEAEVQEMLARQMGGNIAELRKREQDEARVRFADPARRPDLEAIVMGQKLVEAVSASVQLSEEDLKKDYEVIVTKRIAFPTSPGGPTPSLIDYYEKEAAAVRKANGVLAEIRSGLSFEAAMNRYSEDPAPQGKSKSEATVNLERHVIEYDPTYDALQGLKPGEVSPVVRNPAGMFVGIFKIVRVDPPAKEFEQNKAEYRKNRIREIAIRQIADETKKLVESAQWKSPGFEALYAWHKAANDLELLASSGKLRARLLEVAEQAKQALEAADPAGARPASMALFVALDQAQELSSPEQKQALAEQWLDAAGIVLEVTESAELRVRMARRLLDKNETEQALDALVQASQANAGYSDDAFARFQEIEVLRARLSGGGRDPEKLSQLAESQKQWKEDAYEALKGEAELNEDYSEAGRDRYADIKRRLSIYLAEGIVTAEQAKEIEAFQSRWVTEKAKFDQEMAVERKKQEEEAKKAAEEAKKAGSQPSGTTKGG
jgi:hypothetical protein